jgi:predicted carbohydrate-binding protein with CBM5 and CBM33 domain
MKSNLAVLALMAGAVSAHGNITSPPGRLTGPSMAAACGQAAVDAVIADGTIPLENITPATANCTCPAAQFRPL